MPRGSIPQFRGELGQGARITYRFEACISGRLESQALALPFRQTPVILTATASTAAIERSEAGLGLVPVQLIVEVPELRFRTRVRRPGQLVVASGSSGIQLLDLGSVRTLIGVDVVANQYDLSTDVALTGAVFQNGCRLVTPHGVLVLGRARGQATFTAECEREPQPAERGEGWDVVTAGLLPQGWRQVSPDAN